MGFPRQEYWSGLPFPSPGNLPNPGIEPRSLALQANSLLFQPRGKPSQSCLTLCNPRDCTVHGVLQARTLKWVAFSFSWRSSQPRDRTRGTPPLPPPGAPPAPRRPAPAMLPVPSHLHHGLPVSPAPTPGSRRASGTSLPPPGETGGQSIQPTEAIQAV